MLFPNLVAADSYDLDSERTDEKPKSGYVTKKDVKIVAVALIVLVAMLWPVFSVMRRNTERSQCKKNFSAISSAIGLYEADNTEALPPVFDTQSNGSPMVEDGHPYTWINQVYGYMDKPKSSGASAEKRDAASSETQSLLVCPSADAIENTETNVYSLTLRKVITVKCSYGMYAALNAYREALIASPDSTLLISETANFGSAKTCDPVHYKDASGKDITQDGYVIGWNTGNFQPSIKTTAMTRLAFYNTAGCGFSADGEGRHPESNWALFVDGHVGKLKPSQGGTLYAAGNLTPPWLTPPTLGFRSK